jgi:hypothetical protein
VNSSGEDAAATESADYLTDFGLPRGCSNGRWEDEFLVPEFFAQDFFQAAGKESREAWAEQGKGLLSESWPSLFVGNAGTKTGLHVDYGASHFWMLVTEGRKDWVVFPAQMAPFLYKGWSAPHYPVKAFLLEKGLERRPLSAAARGFRGTTKPGDVIFVPSGSIHAVRNTRSPTVAVSMNYVDATNVEAAVRDLTGSHRSEVDAATGRELERFIGAPPGWTVAWEAARGGEGVPLSKYRGA